MQTKQCFKCGEVKSIDEFYVHAKMADGHLGKCKECTKMDMKIRTITNSEYVRNYDVIRSKRPERIAASVERMRKWRLENPEKYKAHNKLNNAIRDGKIIKQVKCEICGKEGKLHAHHSDYSRPLDVIWLCPECHGQIQ